MISHQRQPLVHLAPGEFISGCGGNKQIVTVLGSCISLILWHDPTQFYAMCHFVCVSNNLPAGKIQQADGRYGDQILPHMLWLLRQRKLTPADVDAKLFGGAISAQTLHLVPSFQIGLQNSKFAQAFCRQHHLRLSAQQIATDQSLRLNLHTSSGEVDVTPLPIEGAYE